MSGGRSALGVMEWIGKALMGVAALVFVAGALIYALGRLGGGFLPGDIVVRREHFTFVFPIVTMIVVSVILTVVLNLWFRR